MRYFRDRAPLRLGPFVIYEGTHDGGRHQFYGFRAEPFEPERELVVWASADERPSDPWVLLDEDWTCAGADGFSCIAHAARRGVPLAELMAADLAERQRHVLALGLASAIFRGSPGHAAGRAREIDPASTLVSWRGAVLLNVAEPCLARTSAALHWQMPSDSAAAAIAGCIVGENGYGACLQAARTLATRTATDARSALLIEVLASLLGGKSLALTLADRLKDLTPNAAELGTIAQRGAQQRFLDDDAWDRERAALSVSQLASLAPLMIRSRTDFTRQFDLLRPFLVCERRCRCDLVVASAVPIDGPVRELVLLIAPRDDQIAAKIFAELRDMNGRHFHIDETENERFATRQPAPHHLNPAPAERAHATLAAARAVTLTTPLLVEPRKDCLRVTNDGRVCADGLEPDAKTVAWFGGMDRWRYEWAITLLTVATGGIERPETHDALAKILAGESLRVGDMELDPRVLEAIRAIRADVPWEETRARIAALVGDDDLRVNVALHPRVDARRTFIERERDNIVAVVRQREIAERADAAMHARRVHSPINRMTDVLHDAAREASARVRDSFARLRR